MPAGMEALKILALPHVSLPAVVLAATVLPTPAACLELGPQYPTLFFDDFDNTALDPHWIGLDCLEHYDSRLFAYPSGTRGLAKLGLENGTLSLTISETCSRSTVCEAAISDSAWPSGKGPPATHLHLGCEVRLRSGGANSPDGDPEGATRYWGFTMPGGAWHEQALVFESFSAQSAPPLQGLWAASIVNDSYTLRQPLPAVDMGDWHIYTILWKPGIATFLVDGEEVAVTQLPPTDLMSFTISLSNYFFDQDSDVNPNLTSSLRRQGLAELVSEESMQIDYVHIFAAHEAPQESLALYDLLGRARDLMIETSGKKEWDRLSGEMEQRLSAAKIALLRGDRLLSEKHLQDIVEFCERWDEVVGLLVSPDPHSHWGTASFSTRTTDLTRDYHGLFPSNISIAYPILGLPARIRPGGQFLVRVSMHGEALWGMIRSMLHAEGPGVWDVGILLNGTRSRLSISGLIFESSTCLVEVAVSKDTELGLYDLEVWGGGAYDVERHALSIGEDNATMTIVHVTDPHGPEAILRCADSINQVGSDLIIMTGDLLHPESTFHHLNAPVFVTTGNHDCVSYYRLVNPYPDYAFDFGPIRFVSLDQNQGGYEGPVGMLNAEQILFLDSEISGTEKPVIVFVHDPVGLRRFGGSEFLLGLAGHIPFSVHPGSPPILGSPHRGEGIRVIRVTGDQSYGGGSGHSTAIIYCPECTSVIVLLLLLGRCCVPRARGAGCFARVQPC